MDEGRSNKGIRFAYRRFGKETYTHRIVTHDNFLPHKIGKQTTIDYMLRRTHMRPRDIIQFFNACIVQADGKSGMTPKILLEADDTYSRERLRALADEWFGLYPNLMHLVKLLREAKEVFRINDLSLRAEGEAIPVLFRRLLRRAKALLQ